MAKETSDDVRLKAISPLNSSYASEKDLKDDDYDPHEHRNVPSPTTNFETLVHILKGCFGTGILAMPEAFKHAGLVNGLVCTLLIGVLCTYGMHILVQAQYVLCKRLRVPILTYPESMKQALLAGPKCLHFLAAASPLLVDVFMVVYQLGICCVYVIFVAKNVKALVDVTAAQTIALEYYILMILLPFILIMLVPNLKWLAPFSLFSNLITFASFGIILYYIFQDLPPIEEVPYIGTLYAFPLFFGTTLFALESVGVVIAVENNMKTPKSFGGTFGVLNVAMFFITLTYLGMGFLGYWRYGVHTESSITLNLPETDVLPKVVQGLYSVAIFFSYALQGFVPVEILWNTYLSGYFKTGKTEKIMQVALKIVIVFVTFVLATCIPLLGLFISLFGAFCLSALGIAFPAIMDVCVKWPNRLGTLNWLLIKNLLMIVIGLCGLLAGSYSSLSEIVIQLSNVTKSL